MDSESCDPNAQSTPKPPTWRKELRANTVAADHTGLLVPIIDARDTRRSWSVSSQSVGTTQPAYRSGLHCGADGCKDEEQCSHSFTTLLAGKQPPYCFSLLRVAERRRRDQSQSSGEIAFRRAMLGLTVVRFRAWSTSRSASAFRPVRKWRILSSYIRDLVGSGPRGRRFKSYYPDWRRLMVTSGR